MGFAKDIRMRRVLFVRIKLTLEDQNDVGHTHPLLAISPSTIVLMIQF